MPVLPDRIARIGLAVELESGRKMFLVSEQVAGFLEIEKSITYGPHDQTDHSIDIHLTDLHGYTLVYDLPDTVKQLDAMSAAVEERRK